MMTGLTYRRRRDALLGACALAFATACSGGSIYPSNITTINSSSEGGSDSDSGADTESTGSGTGTSAGPEGSESNSDSNMTGTASDTDPGTSNGTDPDTSNGTDPGTSNGTDPGTSNGTDPGTSNTTVDTMNGTMDTIDPTTDSGGDVCNPDDLDNPCYMCVKDECCEPLAECLVNNPVCSCMYDCVQENGNDAIVFCAGQCNILNPNIPELADLITCATLNCQACNPP